MDIVKKFQPKYYNNFYCIGSECKNNCCNNWTINIDKKTYDRYMNLDEKTKEEFSRKLRLVENGEKGATTALDSEGNCMFLDERGLCTIQLRYGHEYLSNTCKSYPRLTCIVDGSPECFLELSCEAAAKLILFDKGYMGFDEYDLDTSVFEDGTIGCTHVLDTTKYTDAANAINIFWKLRVTSMAILQSRKYRIRFRMLVLCLFIQEVTDLFAKGQDAGVINCAEIHLSRIESDYYKELSSSMPNGADREYSVMFDILKDMYLKKGNLFKRSVYQALKGFDIPLSNAILPQGFNENYVKYYETYFADKEYILENYLVHRVLSEGFPFNYKGDSDVMSNYIDLLAKYNIVEFLFTGICRNAMKFDKRCIIDCISIFTRSYEHSTIKYLSTKDLKSNNK